MLKRWRGRRPEAVQVNVLKKKRKQKVERAKTNFPFYLIKRKFLTQNKTFQNKKLPEAKKTVKWCSFYLFYYFTKGCLPLEQNKVSRTSDDECQLRHHPIDVILLFQHYLPWYQPRFNQSLVVSQHKRNEATNSL